MIDGMEPYSVMVDGDGGLWSLFVDDGALGDGGAMLEMPC